MKSTYETNAKIKDTLSWIAVVVLSLAALYITYKTAISGPMEAMVWLGWFVMSTFFIYLTSTGKQILRFAKESKNELLKVVWPTRQETVQTTTIVIAMVTITGFVLWGIDSMMMWAIARITHLG